MWKSIAAVVCAALLVSACQTRDPYTGEEKTSHATRGAVIGGLAGAGIGALTNRHQAGRNALIGAGIGALAGAAVGGYMDDQEAELRHRLRAAGVSVTRRGDYIILNMESDVTFDVDSDRVKPQFYQVLAAVGEVLAHYNRTTIEVAGHTDSTGSTRHNQELSERRADAVAGVLEDNGVIAPRMYVEGFGEMHPIASNATAAGRAKNRRVEIQIIPFTS
ncbi:MAG: OmpA family protein [Alphaproteobacteria bacterium]|nr:OmpA family protein [Alphaproteobacteria bacterium]